MGMRRIGRNPPVAGTEERHKFRAERIASQFIFNGLGGDGNGMPAAIENLESTLQRANIIPIARPTQADYIQRFDGAVIITGAERRQILHEACDAGEHRKPAEPAELMHHAAPADGDPIRQFHMPGQERAIGERAVIAHLHIVPEMRVAHQKIVMSQRGRLGLRGAMDGDAFADDVVIADGDAGAGLPLGEFSILRLKSDGDIGIEQIIRAERDIGGEMDVGNQTRAGPDTNVRRINYAIGTDLYVVRQLRAGMHQRCGMNFAHNDWGLKCSRNL